MLRRLLLNAFAVLATVTVSGSGAAVQEEQKFYDDFTADALSPVFRVLNPDRTRMALTRDDFLVIAIHERGKNVVQYNGDLPEDYIVTVRIDQPPVFETQAFEIFIGELENNVRVGFYLQEGCPGFSTCHQRELVTRGPYFYTNKTLKSEIAKPVETEIQELQGEPIYLKFEKRGVEFEGFFSADAVEWTSVGTQILINPSAKIHLHAYSWDITKAAESPVRIDSFGIAEYLE